LFLKNEDEAINHIAMTRRRQSVGKTKENICPHTYYYLVAWHKAMLHKANTYLATRTYIIMELMLLLPCHWTQLKKE